MNGTRTASRHQRSERWRGDGRSVSDSASSVSPRCVVLAHEWNKYYIVRGVRCEYRLKIYEVV